MRTIPSRMPRQSLWKHMALWHKSFANQENPLRLDSGAYLVTNADHITAVLKDRHNYVDESAFLRTETFFPLPPKVRASVVRDFIRLMSSVTDEVNNVVTQRLLENPRFAMQSDGVWLMYSLYKDRIHHPGRSDEYGRLIRYYIARKTIHDDIQGGFNRLDGKQRSKLDVSLGAVIKADQSSFSDLVNIVRRTEAVTLPNEQSELLLRLVQSLIAFTGTALEAAFFHLGKNPEWASWIESENHARAYLLELQRLFPTSWRLTRTVKQDHAIGAARLKKDDQIILGSSVAHKAEAYWGDDASVFDPQRWLGTGMHGIFAFGAGHGTCPGKNIAMSVMTSALWSTVNNFSIEPPAPRRVKPYVRSILAAPRTTLTIRPK